MTEYKLVVVGGECQRPLHGSEMVPIRPQSFYTLDELLCAWRKERVLLVSSAG